MADCCSFNLYKESLSYEYDSLGNITKVYENGEVLAEYTYDFQSQLIREKIPEFGLEYQYTYDMGGNICRKIPVNSSRSETVYSYADGNWKDLLSQINNQIIVYDQIGNPTIYGD